METNLQQHNNELIVRLIWFSISFLSIFLVSYFNQNELSSLWISNLEDSIWERTQKIPKMQYLSISDGLKTWFSMHFYWSFLWSFPILIYQLAQFLKPGLTEKEWKNFVLLGFCGTIFVMSISGFLFSNYMWPHILEVLFKFGTQQVDFVPNLETFLSFYREMTIRFAISCSLPWFSFLLVQWNLLGYQQAVKLRRWWILMIFLIATIMSPPDLLSQIVIALPLWFFLELGWFVLAIKEARKIE